LNIIYIMRNDVPSSTCVRGLGQAVAASVALVPVGPHDKDEIAGGGNLPLCEYVQFTGGQDGGFQSEGKEGLGHVRIPAPKLKIRRCAMNPMLVRAARVEVAAPALGVFLLLGGIFTAALNCWR
jgi:hypothetical protein